jgi:hypothetical protein
VAVGADVNGKEDDVTMAKRVRKIPNKKPTCLPVLDDEKGQIENMGATCRIIDKIPARLF